MLVADPSRGWTVVAASGNVAGMLAMPAPSAAVLGRSIGDVLGPSFAEVAQGRFQDGRLRGGVPWQSTLKLEGSPQAFDASVHSHAGLILVELERAGAGDQVDAQTVIRRHQEVIVDLRETGNDLDELALVAARGVRVLTGYERVVIYRFDTDWNGQAIAEDKIADWGDSLGGLHFPATDIPVQAREL